MSNHDNDDWQVIDHTNSRIVPANNRDDAESKISDFDGMDLQLEVCRPGEDPDVMLSQGPSEDVEEPDVDVVQHGENSEESNTDTCEECGEQTYEGPLCRTCHANKTETTSDDTDETEDTTPEVVEAEPVQDSTPTTRETPEFAEYGALDDPLDSLPGWMKTEVSYPDRGDSSTTVNKRGCQVIANYLNVEVETKPVVESHETEFEYAYYRATATHPDGRSATARGVARADGVDQSEDAGWKIEMQAETRAYKRAVKQLTGGGIEAFAKEQEEHHGGKA